MLSSATRQFQRLYPRLRASARGIVDTTTSVPSAAGAELQLTTRAFSLRLGGFSPVLGSSGPVTSFRRTAVIDLLASPRFYSSGQSTTENDETLEAEVVDAPAEAAAVEPEVTSTRTHEFQAETRKLLDIVARSLYSEREVFVRELISNASDALEKLRHRKVTSQPVGDPAHEEEIRITTDELENTLTIQDFGIGMSEAELIKNLGTIAHSGTGEFMNSISAETPTNDLIGQFGVGFYSAFMVADKVTVFSKSALPGSVGIR
ncbi:MAG: ATP-binding protein, partial [archaeon]|nr:ATP-binding protein [archaeon]